MSNKKKRMILMMALCGLQIIFQFFFSFSRLMKISTFLSPFAAILWLDQSTLAHDLLLVLYIPLKQCIKTRHFLRIHNCMKSNLC